MSDALLLFGLMFFVYFFPGFIATGRGHQNQLAIWVLTLLLGWTLLGWVWALVWACTEVKHERSGNDSQIHHG